jgi:hypothetical protein
MVGAVLLAAGAQHATGSVANTHTYTHPLSRNQVRASMGMETKLYFGTRSINFSLIVLRELTSITPFTSRQMLSTKRHEQLERCSLLKISKLC